MSVLRESIKHILEGERIDYSGNLTVGKLIDMLHQCNSNAEVLICNAEGTEYYTDVNTLNDGTVVIVGVNGNYMTVSDLINKLNEYDTDSEIVGKVSNNRLRTITHIWNDGSDVSIMCDI